MYNVSPEFNTASYSDDRTVSIKAIFNNLYTVLGDKLISFSPIGNMTDTENITMGKALSNGITIKMFNPTDTILYTNGWVECYVGLTVNNTVEWCPLGKYYISEYTTTTDGEQITITAYDKISAMAETYVPSEDVYSSDTATISDVATDIATQYGLTIDSSITFPAYDIPYIEGTARDYLGWVAGLMGTNALINRSGKLTFRWYTLNESATIGRNVQYQSGFKRTTEEDFVLQALTSGTEDNIITSGSGRGIQFENPFMTQAILDTIYNAVKGFIYTPCEVKYRCNPAYEVGDVVLVLDKDNVAHNVPIMTNKLTIGSGMNATIIAHGVSDATTVMAQSPTEKKIQAVYSGLKEGFQNTTDIIKGIKGGYYVMTYGLDGLPDGWMIRDTQVLTENTRMWKMSLGGFGFSKDGGATFDTIAFDLNGNFNASAINTGTMSAQRISVGGGTLDDYFNVGNEGGHIYVQIGSSENSITLRQTNDKIAFYAGGETTPTAYFAYNTLRIGQFGLIQQANGNFSITKVGGN